MISCSFKVVSLLACLAVAVNASYVTHDTPRITKNDQLQLQSGFPASLLGRGSECQLCNSRYSQVSYRVRYCDVLRAAMQHQLRAGVQHSPGGELLPQGGEELRHC